MDPVGDGRTEDKGRVEIEEELECGSIDETRADSGTTTDHSFGSPHTSVRSVPPNDPDEHSVTSRDTRTTTDID